MGLFKRRTARGGGNPFFGLWFSGEGSLPEGYTRLMDSPEISGLIDSIAAPIASATIYLMRNTRHGDVRQRDRLARFVDVTPWRHGTRQAWMDWIVTTLLGEGDGNAFVLPHFHGGEGWLTDLEPMPGAAAVPDWEKKTYTVHWRGKEYPPDALLHFRLFADPAEPMLGRGMRVPAAALAGALKQTNELKTLLSSPDYKPPLLVGVNSDADLSDVEKREKFRKEFLEDTDKGKPWILPSDLIKVEQLKPLSLTDLAIKDTVELDKTALASLFRVPPFLLGVGSFDAAAYNNFVRTVLRPICAGIAQTLTLGLLESEDLYFTFNERRLYAYDTAELVTMGLAMSDRGYMTGDEVRAFAMLDPAGLSDFRALENYIPYDLAAMQAKLITGGDKK